MAQSGAHGNMDISDQKSTFHGFMMATVWGCGLIAQSVGLLTLAFAIGAACAGVGGVYYASLVEFIEPGPFHFSTSLMMLLAVIVGGSGRFFGPVVGTVIIILLPEVLRSSSIESLKFMQKWYLVFFGLAVVALMIWLPGGILSIADRFRKPEAPR